MHVVRNFANWWNRLATGGHKPVFRNSREALEFIRRVNNSAEPTPEMVRMRQLYVQAKNARNRRENLPRVARRQCYFSIPIPRNLRYYGTTGGAMGFIERELDRIGATLCSEPDAPDYDRLYAAQQALAWAMDPTGFASPIKHIRPDTQEDSRDCPGCPDPTPAA